MQSFDNLPDNIRQRAYDHLRLSPSKKGLDAANDAMLAWENSLTKDELATAKAWFLNLPKQTQLGIIYSLARGKW